MKQYGGEGKESYKGNKNDSGLKQHGGEGGSAIPGGRGGVDWTPSKNPNPSYTGPGRSLKSV